MSEDIQPSLISTGAILPDSPSNYYNYYDLTNLPSTDLSLTDMTNNIENIINNLSGKMIYSLLNCISICIQSEKKEIRKKHRRDNNLGGYYIMQKSIRNLKKLQKEKRKKNALGGKFMFQKTIKEIAKKKAIKQITK